VTSAKPDLQDPKQVVLLFNECINRHDLDGLAALMTEDHTFVGRDGTVSQPKSTMVRAWREFFWMFPEYRNTFTRIESRNDQVAVLGYAYWSKEKAHDPAIWTASIAGVKVREWRIHDDTPENRLKFHLVSKGGV
jgi:ketosteroid isomerase-like protein